ncbi:MAG: 3'-5' exonuclease [Planctomycetes bacterium]|nr:3'-5' exonuclease [Planctomycetota bacterium]
METVADGRLVQRVRYPEAPELTPQEAMQRYREELMDKNGSDFIPHTFQMPVSVAIALIDDQYRLQRLTSLDCPQFRPHVICKQFWQGWEHYKCPCFVTFNGRGFDIPVMEMTAYRYGYSLPKWFGGSKWEQPRNRYNSTMHFDLLDFMSNHGAGRINGGLNLCATLLGKPGKLDTKGDMVQDLWDQGEHVRIDNYCQCDALDTYFVFLRSCVLRGFIDIDREQEIVAEATEYLRLCAEENEAIAEYLNNFSHWEKTEDTSWPFLDKNDDPNPMIIKDDSDEE